VAPISEGEIAPGFVEQLLARPTPRQRLVLLRTANLLNADGFDRLLDVADGLVSSDPGKAHRLSELCANAAEVAGLPAVAARSAYIRLQTHFANGEFDAALRMAREAYEGYVACGKDLEALRTHIGRMSVLIELGLYQEAIDAGQVVLDALGGGELEVAPSRQQVDLLTALVHQNRGGCYEYMGRYDEALEAYAVAEERYRSLGEIRRLGEILDNRGAILLSRGRGNEALAAHEAAADVFARAGFTLSHAKALCNIGEANRWLGNYSSSLTAFEQARRLYGSLEALADRSLLTLDTANVYLDLNLYPEALAAYHKADSLLRNAGMAHDRARALWGMGVALTAKSNFEQADEVLAEASQLFAVAGNLPMLSGVMLDQSVVQEVRGGLDASVATARRALGLVLDKDFSVQRVYAHLRLVDLVLPDAVEAESHLQAARRLAERMALPQLRYRLNERLGRLRRLQGNDEEARVLLGAAIDEIERLRGTVTHESMRAFFLLDKIGAYEELLKLDLSKGDESDSRRVFDVAERAKSRALVDLLTGVADEPAHPADDTLQERIQDLQADLNATYNRLLGTGEGESAAPLPDLRGRAVDLEGEISRLRLRAIPAASDPFTSSVPSDAWQDLPTDVTLLAYHVVGDEIVAFVVARDRIRIARNCGSLTTVTRLLQQLDVQWDRSGAGREFVKEHGVLLERLTRKVLTSLYGELVAPLEPLLDEAVGAASAGNEGPPKIVIVPHGLLHQVPFHGLFDGGSYLLDRFEVSYAPSAKVFSLCQKQASRGLDDALVLGLADPLIPAVADEARAVARHLPSAEVLTAKQATLAALREKAPGCGVLHLACHGMFRADNPMFSSLKLHDGWLTAADVLSLDLGGALVTLSACESARNQVLAGDELVGLTRGFLGAGATTLVASLWLVRDETTAWMMEKWYAGLRDGVGRAAALRNAQLALKEECSHPYYWAPFVLIGQR
jgi:CHAT domain-containing protein